MNHRRERRHTVEIMQIACVGASGLGVAMAERWRSVSASSALAVMPIVMPTGTNSGETQRTATDRQSSILARWRTVADAYEEGTAHPVCATTTSPDPCGWGFCFTFATLASPACSWFDQVAESDRRSTRSSARSASATRTRARINSWHARSSESASTSGSPPRFSPNTAWMTPPVR